MIELTDLNGVPFIVNCALIETIQQIPETKITLTTGKYYLVSTKPDEIVKKTISYNQQIFMDKYRLK